MPPALRSLSDDQVALSWLIRLRWGALAAQAVLVGALVHWLAPEISGLELYVIVSLGILSNGFAYFFSRGATQNAGFWVRVLLCLDIGILTALLYYSGGSSNPFSTLYLTQVTIAAVLLGARWASILGIVACLCYGFLFYYFVPIGIEHQMHDHSSGGYELHLRGMWLSFAFVAASTVFFVTKVRTALREKEQELSKLRRLEAQHEKLAALATLSAGAAHELSTPLSTIGFVVSDLARHLGSGNNTEETREDLQIARSEVGRCKQILQSMSGQFSTYAEDNPEITTARDFQRLLEQTFTGSAVVFTPGVIEYERQLLLDQKGWIRCVETLLDNALVAQGRLAPVSIRFDAGRDQLRVTVRNDGAIIPPDILVHLGEPFFTTKEPGEGMGLGLFLVRLFCQRYGGSFNLVSNAENGTEAIMFLPLRRSEYEHAA